MSWIVPVERWLTYAILVKIKVNNFKSDTLDSVGALF